MVVGENETFIGAEDYLRNNGIEVEVIQDPDYIDLMLQFTGQNPAVWNKDIGV